MSYNKQIMREAGLYHDPRPFQFENGETIPELEIAWESYGRLNAQRSNAILVCHALTGSAYAAGEAVFAEEILQKAPMLAKLKGSTAGWWDAIIGPGKLLDTEKYFIICSNVIGSCYGSSGPLSINPKTGTPYGNTFPQVSVRDMVKAQKRLLEAFKIETLFSGLGGSLGGMQLLEWMRLFPEKIQSAVLIGTSARHSDWSIGLNHLARQAIFNDPVYNAGDYSTQPEKGLALAREIGMMTYRTVENFNTRFGHEKVQEPTLNKTFQVESYLQYQGQKLVNRFDANSFIQLSQSMDAHDIAPGCAHIEEGLKKIKTPVLTIGIYSDLLYPAAEQKQIADGLANGRYAELHSPYGHDAFLIEFEKMEQLVRPFFNTIEEK